MPGLEVIRAPNGDISLKIRGGDLSLNNDTTYEPLLVIDGMPVSEGQVGSTLRALNPQEVARIDVLKDVSSTSMYGIRGAHGVIVSTMKHQ